MRHLTLRSTAFGSRTFMSKSVAYNAFYRFFSDTLNPMVTIETCGEKKYSSAKSEVAVGSTALSHWKEHLFFEPRGIVSLKT